MKSDKYNVKRVNIGDEDVHYSCTHKINQLPPSEN